MLLQWSAQVKVDRVFLAVSLIDGDLSQSTFLYITLCVWALSGMEYPVVWADMLSGFSVWETFKDSNIARLNSKRLHVH